MPALRLLPVVCLVALCACPGPNQTHPPPGAYVPPGPQTLSCLPNLDGQISAAELQPAIGAVESFLISAAGTQPTVDVAGQVNAAGQHVWDWSATSANDQLLHLSPTALAGKPYAASFPGGQFTLPLDAAGTIDAIYSEDAQTVWLLGFASAQASANGTLLVYQQPVAAYRFPLQPGETWTSVGQVVNGMLQGLPYAGQDTYDISVDAAGQLDLPDLTFQQALRVRTQLTTTPVVGTPVSRRQVSFLFECFGEVARATSLDNEPNADFTVASEVRRLGLQ